MNHILAKVILFFLLVSCGQESSEKKPDRHGDYLIERMNISNAKYEQAVKDIRWQTELEIKMTRAGYSKGQIRKELDSVKFADSLRLEKDFDTTGLYKKYHS